MSKTGWAWFQVLVLSATTVAAAAGRESRVVPLASALLDGSASVLVVSDGREELIWFSLDAAPSGTTGELVLVPLPTNAACESSGHDPFKALAEILKRKALQCAGVPVKGVNPRGSSTAVSAGAAMAACFSMERIADWPGFQERAAEFCMRAGIPPPYASPELKSLVEGHLRSGIRFFLFLRRAVQGKAGAPVVVRFRSHKVFFPLRAAKASSPNAELRLFMALPGSIGLNRAKRDITALLGISADDGATRELSSSAKIYPDELAELCGQQLMGMSAAATCYLQLLRLGGGVAFAGDLELDAGNLAPFAYVFELFEPEAVPGDLFSIGELLDYEQAQAVRADHPDWALPSATASLEIPGHSDLKPGCLSAALRAIELEIANCQDKLEAARHGPGDPGNIRRFQERIAELRSEFLALRELRVGRYPLPEKRVLRVHTGSGVKENGLLDTEGASRSGPFYHLAGIRNGDYGQLSPRSRYELTAYLVRQRDYPFPDFYVYVSGWERVR
jgi:hypothetical protein